MRAIDVVVVLVNTIFRSRTSVLMNKERQPKKEIILPPPKLNTTGTSF